MGGSARMKMLGLMVAIATLAVVVPSAGALRSPSELRGAWVPSLCGHPAGRLVDGTLPGIPENMGHVTLDETKVAVGRFIPGRRREAAAVVSCNAGGVSHPDNIVFYNARGRFVGVRRLGDVTGGDRGQVRRIWISGGTVHVQVVGIVQEGDAACCGTASAKLEYEWNADRSRIVNVKKKIFTERRAARRLLGAVDSDNPQRALRFTTADVVDSLFPGQANQWELARCEGPLNDAYRVTQAPRECDLTPIDPGFFFVTLGMEQTSWKRWHATSYTFTTTD